MNTISVDCVISNCILISQFSNKFGRFSGNIFAIIRFFQLAPLEGLPYGSEVQAVQGEVVDVFF